MDRRLCALLAALALAVPATASETTNPIRYTWIVTSCPTWNCAAAAMVLADGDPHVLVLPTAREDRPWLVLKRVEAGSIYIPEDEPFTCEVFDTAAAATTRFEAMDQCHSPMVLTVPDGRAVVTSASLCETPKSTRRRAAGH